MDTCPESTKNTNNTQCKSRKCSSLQAHKIETFTVPFHSVARKSNIQSLREGCLQKLSVYENEESLSASFHSNLLSDHVLQGDLWKLAWTAI